MGEMRASWSENFFSELKVVLSPTLHITGSDFCDDTAYTVYFLMHQRCTCAGTRVGETTFFVVAIFRDISGRGTI